MRKKAKHGINAGNSFKFGPHAIRPGNSYHLLKRVVSSSHLMLEAQCRAADERLQRSGVLRALQTTGADARRLTTGCVDDQHVVFSLKKHKRWEFADKLEQLIHDVRDDTDNISDSDGVLVSLTQKRQYGDIPQSWEGFSERTCTHYCDTSAGATTAASTFSSRQTLKHKLTDSRKVSVKVKKRHPGHNQHFRGVQRKSHLVKKRFPDETPGNQQDDQLELRYDVIRECPKNGHPFHYIRKYGRSVSRIVEDTGSLPGKALNIRRRRHEAASVAAQQYCDLIDGLYDSDDLQSDTSDDVCLLEGDDDVSDDVVGDYIQSSSKRCYDFSELLTKPPPRKRAIICVTSPPVDTSTIRMLSGDCVKKRGVIAVDDVTLESSEEAASAASEPAELPSDVPDLTSKLHSQYRALVQQVPPSHVVAVKTDDILPSTLRDRYGDAYMESNSKPWRFMISLRNGTAAGQFANQCAFVLFECAEDPSDSHCVAVHEWDELSTRQERIRLRLEGDFTAEQRRQFSAYVTRLDDALVLTDFIDFVTALIQQSSARVKRSGQPRKAVPSLAALESVLRWRCDVFDLTEARRVVQTERTLTQKLKDKASGLAPGIAGMSADLDTTCAICYNDTTTNGIALTSCRHRFCDECWRYHLMSRIEQGAQQLTCAGFDCDTEVDDVTLLSLLSFNLYYKHWCRLQDMKLDQSSAWQWCPNKRCSAVVLVRPRASAPPAGSRCLCVSCVCSKAWCFDCQSESHWPASCSAHQNYMQAVAEQQKAKSEDRIVYVKVKKCPTCKHPINKNGGCSYMQCRCGAAFCWECLTPWQHHLSNGLVCARGRVDETSLRLEDEINLRMNEYLQSLALKYRELRMRARTIYGDRERTFRAHVLHELGRRRSSSARDYSAVFNISRVVALTYSVEQTDFKHACSLLYEGYHVLEYTLVALSQMSHRKRPRLLARLQCFALVLTRVEQLLTLSKPAISFAQRLLQLRQATHTVQLFIETIARRMMQRKNISL